ncbi:hypothetical protein BKA70DRAFT_1424706 [Coprinopsis sp. MPI-PUGE-AT-0042]|nr:hypothetical protein BKA70DRAFT_1424706 [Coprinopsis sp. MPI-PUGE-AT-0042]
MPGHTCLVYQGLRRLSDEKGHARISFVMEGEASLHYCVKSGLSAQAIQRGEGMVIVDAGGGTIDISSYRGQNGKFEEIAAPQSNETCVPERYWLIIKFASSKENDPDLGIRFGQIKLGGPGVATFLQPSVECVIKGVKQQRTKSRHPTKTVLLVGGFAASDWLFSQLTAGLQSHGMEVYRPDGHTNKAVSDGGASFYLDKLVNRRVAKAAFGTDVYSKFDPRKPSHCARRDRAEPHPFRDFLCFNDTFFPILKRDEIVAETREFRCSFYREFRYRADIEMFDTLFSVTVDASRFPVTSEISTEDGAPVFRVEYEVIFRFGLTELQAQVAWKEGGSEFKTKAKLVYEPAD